MSLVVAMGVNYDSDILKIKDQFFVLQKRELNRFCIIIINCHTHIMTRNFYDASYIFFYTHTCVYSHATFCCGLFSKSISTSSSSSSSPLSLNFVTLSVVYFTLITRSFESSSSSLSS